MGIFLAKVALEQVFPCEFQFLPCQCHFTNTPHSFTYHRSHTNLASDSNVTRHN